MSEGDELFRAKAVEAQNVMHGRVRIAPPVSWTATNTLLVGIVLFALIFASLASYSQTIEVEGRLETNPSSNSIYAPSNGVVQVHVQQGEKVKAGQHLASTMLENIDGTNESVRQRKNLLLEEVADAQQSAQAARRAAQNRANASSSQANSARDRASSLGEQLSYAREQTRVAEGDLARARDIAERGFLSKRDLEQREAAVSRHRQEEARLKEEISRARGEAAEAEALAAEAISSGDVAARLALQEASRAERDLASDGFVSQTRHMARIDGVLASVPVRSGQTVKKGQVIAVVVPEDAQMSAMLPIPSNAMADIRAGQAVGISIDAYPYESFGLIQGKIRSVSQIAIQTESGSAYLVEARMPQEITVYGKKVRLLPGMTLSARIQSRERTLIEWLLDPLYAVSRR